MLLTRTTASTSAGTMFSQAASTCAAPAWAGACPIAAAKIHETRHDTIDRPPPVETTAPVLGPPVRARPAPATVHAAKIAPTLPRDARPGKVGRRGQALATPSGAGYIQTREHP